MSAHETIELRPLAEGDEPRILESFQRAFARLDPAAGARSVAHWRWLYRENPSGTQVQLAVDETGSVLAHYAALPARALLEGRPALFGQIVDSFVLRDARTGLARRGLFARTALAWRERWMGAGEGRCGFVYGLPVTAAWRVGHRQLGYGLLREGLLLAVEAARLARGQAPALAVEELSALGVETDALFARCAQGRAACLVHDAAFLSWRFLRSPLAGRARVGALREGEQLRALAVWTPSALAGGRAGTLAAWLCPVDDGEARAALLAWLAAATLAAGLERLVADFAPHASEWQAFQRAGFRAVPGAQLWAGQSALRAHPLSWFRRNLWTAPADTDLL